MTEVTTSDVIPYGSEFVVEIYINEEFWEHRIFLSQEEADKFRADPLAADREEAQRKLERHQTREAEEAKYRAHNMMPVSRGRRIGRKPGAA